MDGVIKFWDLRMHLSSQSYGDDGLSAVGSGPNDTNGYTLLPTPPLLKAVRGGHTHWTTRAVYNPFYDQLVLSGGSDGIANLWRISSCSSAPLLELDGEDEEDIGGELHDDDVDEEDYDEGLNEDKKETEDWMDDNNQRPTNEVEDENDDKEQSSENYGASNTSRIESSAPDVRVAHFECSDTTADVAWSASDPWMYATLSYDGALVVHHVPSKEKYKILL
jgi:WD40 repeat protein